MSTCLHGKQHCSTCLPSWDTFLLWEVVVRKALKYYRDHDTGNDELNKACYDLQATMGQDDSLSS